jgi:hypothetical protein
MNVHSHLAGVAVTLALSAQTGVAQGPVCAPADSAHRPAGPVALPIELANNHIYVRACVGSRPLWFLLDSGAGVSLLDLGTAEALGLALGDRIEARGAGPGATRGAQLAGVSAYLPQDPSVAVPIPAALALTGLAAFEGRQPNGILGHDFIEQAVLQIDYHGRRLVLHDPETFRYAGPGARVPLRLVGNSPHVSAELVLADGGRVAADFVLDLGSSLAVVLTKPLVDAHGLRRRVGPTITRPAGRGAGGSASAEIGRLAGLEIGTAQLRAPLAYLYGDSAGVFSVATHFEGNIGGEVLRRFTVYLDYAHQELILEANADRAEPFETDMSGAVLVADSAGAGMRVAVVTPGTPAAEAGLAPDDLIVTVDGRPASDVGLGPLRMLLRRAGTIVALTVRRDGRDRVVRLTLRRLV